jgi:hypothetical protein
MSEQLSKHIKPEIEMYKVGGSYDGVVSPKEPDPQEVEISQSKASRVD